MMQTPSLRVGPFNVCGAGHSVLRSVDRKAGRSSGGGYLAHHEVEVAGPAEGCGCFLRRLGHQGRQIAGHGLTAMCARRRLAGTVARSRAWACPGSPSTVITWSRGAVAAAGSVVIRPPIRRERAPPGARRGPRVS